MDRRLFFMVTILCLTLGFGAGCANNRFGCLGGSCGGQRRGGGGMGSGGSIAGHSEVETAPWITVEGSVVSADAEALVVSTVDGETVVG